MNLTKCQDGSYRPSYPNDDTLSAKIKVGAEVTVTKSRNIDFHRKMFALLALGLDNQDRFDDKEIYRMWLTLKCGYVVFVPDENGVDQPHPKSWAFDKMNAEEFENLYNTAKSVIAAELRLSGSEVEKEVRRYF